MQKQKEIKIKKLRKSGPLKNVSNRNDILVQKQVHWEKNVKTGPKKNRALARMFIFVFPSSRWFYGWSATMRNSDMSEEMFDCLAPYAETKSHLTF